MKIINAEIVLATETIKNGCVVVKDGKIIFVGANDTFSTNETYETVDAKGMYLLPGFIDIHCHGGNGFDFMDATADEMRKISEFHLQHGTTTLYATTMTDSWENIEAALKNYDELVGKNGLLTLGGVHLEGPWFSPNQCGAQDKSNMLLPSKAKIDELTKKYPFVKRISIAPELKDAIEVGRYAGEKGLVVSAGHTDADFDTVIKASENGYALLTHFYSGMSGVVRKNLYRVAGAVEAGYYSDDLNVEIIADGKHLPDSLLKLIYKVKGADKTCLITDGTRGSGLNEGDTFKLGRRDTGVDCVIEDGVAKLIDKSSFAGSVATADRLFKKMTDCGISIVDVSKMSSGTPARIMGLTDRGEIKEGKRADLILMNGDSEVQQVFLNGEISYKKGERQ